jgi:hypothetical protein
MAHRTVLSLALLLMASVAWARPVPPTPVSQVAGQRQSVPSWATHPKVSPALGLAAQLQSVQGRTFVPKAVVIELSQDLDDRVISSLRRAGADVVRGPRGVLHVGRNLGLRLKPGAMDRLISMPEVRRIDVSMPLFPFPLNVADDVQGGHELMEERLGYREVGNTFSPDGKLTRGFGVVTNVTDFNLDPFHPLLFHADGGVYSWIDVNQNGVFDHDVDGVDMNEDGEISGMEILRLAEFPVVVLQQGGPVTNSDGVFTPFSDYVFLDQNANGSRDVGDAINATAYTLGLSEPTFVGDDVNRNGILDPDERLFRLGTPKIKAIYDVGNDKTYNPGPGFSEYLTNIRSGRSLDDIEFHGTYECTRVAGGHGEIWHQGGVAPSADIIFVDIESGSGGVGSGDLVSALAWARDLGARAYNYAYGEVISNFSDGSSILETSMAELHATGRIQSASAGNEAGSGRHAIVDIPAGSSMDIPFWVGGRHFSPSNAFFVFRWPGTNLVTIPQVELPDGTLVEGLPSDAISTSEGDIYLSFGGGSSPRGNGLMYRAFTAASGGDVPKGSWLVRVQNQGTSPIHLDIWVATSFPWPLAWINDEDIMSNLQTITYPATADGVFAVGACSAFAGSNYGPWDCPLAGYSSRGPRIDGVRQLSFVAPTDMLSGYPLLKYAGGYIMFGGTSGASPHITGSAALMFQAMPDLEYMEPNDLFLAGLSTDVELGVLPNFTWGEGILNSWAAVFPGKVTSKPASPTQLALDVPSTVVTSTPFVVSFDVVDQGGVSEALDLTIRVDLGYDGSYDLGPVEGGELEIPGQDEPGALVLRIQVVDGKGNLWNEVVTVSVEDPPDPELSQGDTVASETSSSDATPAADVGAPPTENSGGCAAQGAGPFGSTFALLFFVLFAWFGSARRRERTSEIQSQEFYR